MYTRADLLYLIQTAERQARVAESRNEWDVSQYHRNQAQSYYHQLKYTY